MATATGRARIAAGTAGPAVTVESEVAAEQRVIDPDSTTGSAYAPGPAVAPVAATTAGTGVGAGHAGRTVGAGPTAPSVPADTADTTGSAACLQREQLAVGAAGTTVPASTAGLAVTAIPTRDPGVGPRHAGCAASSRPADPAVAAADQSVGPADPADPTGAVRTRRLSTGAAVTAGAPQARLTAGAPRPAIGARRARAAVAAVADKPPSVTTGLSGSRRAAGAVAEHRAPRRQLNRREDSELLKEPDQ